MKHIKLKIINKIYFILIAISFLSTAFSLEVGLSAPSEVELNKPFSASIDANTQDKYDIKIYIKNLSDSILSETDNLGSWKNSRFYINDAFPSIKYFNITAIKFSEFSEICAKLRLSEKRKSNIITPETCLNIKIFKSDNLSEKIGPKIKEKESESKTSEKLAKNNTSIKKNSPRDNFTQSQDILPQSVSNTLQQENEAIIITPQVISNAKNQTFISNQQKISLILVYSFIFLLIFIIILFLLRRI